MPLLLCYSNITDNHLVEKERKQAEKNAKFAAKKAKEAAASTTQLPSRTKEKKSTVEAGAKAALPEYIEETPTGHKKSEHSI